MDSLSKQELISNITKQSDQIKRYEARLRDVVAAYKGLAKEKEALETSLKALNQGEKSENQGDDNVAALALSLSTLTTEKARMEEAFQTDKKVTREKYENMIASLREEIKTLTQQHTLEVNNLKAKISYEIQEREKERADCAAMMKELHLKLNSERITKEGLEDKVGNSSDSQVSQAELEKKVRDLSSSLEAAQRRLQRAEARTVETPALLVRLQQKLALVEQSHSIAIREEQIKVKRAEESARKQCARQEDRVATLEGKIAELSQTIGEYEIQRRKDSNTIKQLQDSLNAKILDTSNSVENQCDSERILRKRHTKDLTDAEKMNEEEYVQALVEKIKLLKQELFAENAKLSKPLDLTSLFRIDSNDSHLKCQQSFDALSRQFQSYKDHHPPIQVKQVSIEKKKLETVIREQEMEITKLAENLDRVKMMMEEEKHNKIASQKLLEEKLRNEKAYHEDVVNGLKLRVQSLEKQVEIQRDRYATLLDETDNYIRARNEKFRKLSLEGHGMMTATQAGPHMLHYAHEIARKDLDITQLRKEKHTIEGQLRDCQRESTMEKERNKEEIRYLKDNIARLTRIQTREGANLEYLKNVVMAYLMTTDDSGKRHMLNAIAAVLNFTNEEKKESQKHVINEINRNKVKIRFLKDTIATLTSLKPHECVQLEYIKHVVKEFMLATEAHAKRHLLNDIAQALNFTDEDKKIVLATLR